LQHWLFWKFVQLILIFTILVFGVVVVCVVLICMCGFYLVFVFYLRVKCVSCLYLLFSVKCFVTEINRRSYIHLHSFAFKQPFIGPFSSHSDSFPDILLLVYKPPNYNFNSSKSISYNHIKFLTTNKLKLYIQIDIITLQALNTRGFHLLHNFTSLL